MHHYQKQSHPERIGIALGLVVALCGGTIFLRHAHTMRAYADLASNTASHASASNESSDGSKDTSEIDWESLRRQNADIAAWIRLEGTSIDLPVMSSHDDDATYYLSHDFWRNDAPEGTPFLDHRCNTRSAHMLIYGHHLNAGGQFSELQLAYQGDTFAELGDCYLYTPSQGERVFLPFCSCSADAWDQTIQTFEFTQVDTLESWLVALADRASAKSDTYKQLTGKAASALTLVTCSSDASNESQRTMVTFVEVLIEKQDEDSPSVEALVTTDSAAIAGPSAKDGQSSEAASQDAVPESNQPTESNNSDAIETPTESSEIVPPSDI